MDRIVREAMAEGKFDNLPGRGKPLPVGPPGGPQEPAFRILRNAGFAPEWVELERAIEAARAEAAAALEQYAAERDGAVSETERLRAEWAAPAPARRRGWMARLRSGGAEPRGRLDARLAAAAEALNAAAQQACRAQLQSLHAVNQMIARVNLVHPARGCQHFREDPGRAARAFAERFPRLLLATHPDAPPEPQWGSWEVPEEWLQPPAPQGDPLPPRVRGDAQLDALVEYRRSRQHGGEQR